MNKQTITAAVFSIFTLIIGIGIGGAIVKVRLLDRAVLANRNSITQLEGTISQVVQFINANARPGGGPAEGTPVGPVPE